MAITAYNQVDDGGSVTISVDSDLSGAVYYHWYIDGSWVGFTTQPVRSFTFEDDEQVEVTVQDTTDADYDAVANAPEGYPARRSIWWIRSVDLDVVSYRVEQKLGAGSWETIGTVIQDADTWSHSMLTPRLDDLSTYTWRVIPVNTAGNDGTALTIGPELIVRTPDAPNVEITFDDGTTRVTFSEAA